MKKVIFILSLVCFVVTAGKCQSSEKLPRYFGEPIITDTTSTIFFPIRYNEEFLSTNKIAIWGDYYANLVVYDFLKGSYRKLFEKDTYIEALQYPNHYSAGLELKPKNLTDKWVFLLVKSRDYNSSGRIDEKDPSLLFAATTTGKELKQLTNENENVISFNILERQGIVLIKIQRDLNKDQSFKAEDKDYYFRKINLIDLSLGKGIEVKSLP